jgi:hypothetical protein
MSLGDEVVVVILWDALLKQSPVYESALKIFSRRAHKAPNINTKRTLLLNIVSRSSETNDFQQLKKQCYARWMTMSTCVRVWTMLYTAKKLALLLVLHNQDNGKEKVRASPRAGTMPQMNNLKLAFCNLFDGYDKSLVSYIKTKQAEADKSVCLPLLDHQLKGPLLQYNHTWNQRKKDVDGCRCCLHVSTMAIKFQADVNAKNCELRAKASAGGGDGKFVAASALYGCYCSLNNCCRHQG